MILKIILFCALFCVIVSPSSVNADDSLSLIPSSISVRFDPVCISQTQSFLIAGYEGVLSIQSENLPVTITPSSLFVKEGDNVQITIKNANLAPSSVHPGLFSRRFESDPDKIYEGNIVFVSEGDFQTKIKCKVRVREYNPSPIPTLFFPYIYLLFVLLVILSVIVAMYAWR